VGIEFARIDATREVLGNGQTVSGGRHEGCAVEWHHTRLAKQADPGWALGENRRKGIGTQRDSIDIVQKQTRLGLDQLRRQPLVEFLPLADYDASPGSFCDREIAKCQWSG